MSVNDSNNVYARNVEDKVIHVSAAKRGRKGYYCLGCDDELEAVRPKVANIIDYFRHVPRDVTNKSKCTYRDETHRHKLAKEILQRIKRVKVPAVYKYPPKGQTGLANLILKSTFINAEYIGIETSFYENESGEIHHGSNKDIEEKFLLIRPDVTFFNEKKEPILFIEIVVTHKIKIDKLVKLKRLGINTIQIKIPKDSPEKIEASFSITNYTKWVFNHVEERTEYVPTTESDSEAVLQIDELQRELHDESFACRTAEIKSLVRGIKRCLESEPYRKSEDWLRSEISRVERNSDSNRTKLEGIRENCRRSVQGRYKTEIDNLELRKCELERETKQFEENYRDLESRYYRKRALIERENSELERGISTKIEGVSGSRGSIEYRRRKIIEARNKSNRDFESARDESIRRYSEALEDIERGRERLRDIKELGDSIPERFERLAEQVRSRFEELRNREIQEIEQIEGETRNEPTAFNKAEEAVRNEFEGIRGESLIRVKTRDSSGVDELSRGINQLLQTRGRLIDFSSAHKGCKRYREAWESFKQRAYKNWTD